MSQGQGIVGFTSGEPRQDIACPGCGFAPFVGMQWSCSPDGCGGTFDTFATRARCPHCDAQFAWTIRRLSLPGHHPARLGLGAPQDATGAERCAVSVGPSIECSRLRPIAPASVSRDYRTTDREIHVSVTVPSSHPGRREARPADRTSRPLHRLLRCRQRRALPSKDSSRARPPASFRPFPRRSPW